MSEEKEWKEQALRDYKEISRLQMELAKSVPMNFHESEIKSLDSRLTQAEAKLADDDWRWKEYFGASKEEYHKKVKECEELRTRVAELEKTVSLPEHVEFLQVAFQRDWKANFEKANSKNEELQTRLSTLLKASEGMEKALEEITKVKNLQYNIPIATREQIIASKALAEWDGIK